MAAHVVAENILIGYGLGRGIDRILRVLRIGGEAAGPIRELGAEHELLALHGEGRGLGGFGGGVAEQEHVGIAVFPDFPTAFVLPVGELVAQAEAAVFTDIQIDLQRHAQRRGVKDVIPRDVLGGVIHGLAGRSAGGGGLAVTSGQDNHQGHGQGAEGSKAFFHRISTLLYP